MYSLLHVSGASSSRHSTWGQPLAKTCCNVRYRRRNLYSSWPFILGECPERCIISTGQGPKLSESASAQGHSACLAALPSGIVAFHARSRSILLQWRHPDHASHKLPVVTLRGIRRGTFHAIFLPAPNVTHTHHTKRCLETFLADLCPLITNCRSHVCISPISPLQSLSRG